jgi:hypothetical protein
MKTFNKIKDYAIKIAKEKNACKSELQKLEESKNLDELILIVRLNAKWIKNNHALNDKISIELFGLSLSNLFNIGNWNSGDWNSGNMNSGNKNSGDFNSGNKNSGDFNSGDFNSGDLNSGDWNSGNKNSGDFNSGDFNSGDLNSGDWNSGDFNSGDRNSGNWNSGNMNSGYFNSEQPKLINVFNKPCSIEIWNESKKPQFIYNLILTKWISFEEMTEDEKINNPKAYLSNGYLKTLSYKESWENAFKEARENDIVLLKNLPNFDSDVFFEITGLKI